ncbi:hypothetical protein JNW90_23680 [Micromonospora sp. STR1s_5]|nr:hypothetical protein [Micromonospora sp. STR1s_5]
MRGAYGPLPSERPSVPGLGSRPSLPGPDLGEGDPLIALIRRKEGTSGPRGFNTSLAHGALLPGGRDTTLTDKTFRQIYDLQTAMLKNPANRWNSSAIGVGQFVRNTLFKDRNGRGTPDNPGKGSVVQEMGISPDQLFDEQTQLRMMAHLIRRRGRDPVALGGEWEGLKRFSNPGEILSAYDQREQRIRESGGDWFPRAMNRTGSGAQRIEGDASLRIKFDGLPRGSRVDSDMNGMFRRIDIDRGRSMQMPDVA